MADNPEGYDESSRWSQRSGDHRKPINSPTAPRRGAEPFLAPFQGANCFPLSTGGLRCATTTGYYLSAFQADFCRLAKKSEAAHARLNIEAVAVDPVLLNFITDDSFRGVEQLRCPLTAAARCLQRVHNDVSLKGLDSRFEREPRHGT